MFTDEHLVRARTSSDGKLGWDRELQTRGIDRMTARRETAEETPTLTRTARTLAATAVNKIGLRLVEFSPEDLDQLELPEDLREAIDVCQKLKIRARSRQKRRVCQVLRSLDHEAIAERVSALEERRGAAASAGANEHLRRPRKKSRYRLDR